MTKRILVYVTPDERASLFDVIVFHDMDVDVVLPYTKVPLDGITDLVYDSVFSRSPRFLKDLAFFVGGSDIEDSERMIAEIVRVLDGLPAELRVSVAADPAGAYTTGASVVAKVKGVLGSLKDANVVVLAGTGPVGTATATFFGLEGAKVGLSSRMMESASRACGLINMKYALRVDPLEINDESSLETALKNSTVVVSCGPPGVQLLSKGVWEKMSSLRVLADINAVSPAGIEGVEPDFDGVSVFGKTCFGAIGLGEFKMRVHKKLVNDLFRERGVIFNLKGVHALAEKLA